MWDNFFEILPSMFLLIFSMIIILRATKLKYSLKTTILIVTPCLLLIIASNIYLFSGTGIDSFDSWSILSVFIPEAIIAMFLGKRKGISKLSAIVSTYVAYYIIVLLRNVVHIYLDSLVLEYVMYAVFIPLVFIYVEYFYNHLHDRIEELIPKFLYFLLIYSTFIYSEFYMYGFLIKDVSARVLRLEIFGVAIISVYIVSIFIFDSVLRSYHSSFEKIKENEKYGLQMEQVLNQFKIRDEKDKQLRIIRHDMKHLLILVSTLIQEGKTNEALDTMNQEIQLIDSTKIMRYCKDEILNSIICYYDEICKQNDIKLRIRMNNIEDALNIKTSEVAILLSNCFENAINATSKVYKKREIEFKFINKNGNLVMQMRNYHNGVIEYDANNLPTSSKDNHGIGTKSIKAFVDKYKLTLDYDITESSFAISIIFN